MLLAVPIFLSSIPSATSGDDRFAVDQEAHAAERSWTLAALLEGRIIHHETWKSDLPDRLDAILQKLRRREFDIIAPFERSSHDPDLPTYLEIRKNCPKFDFEFIRPNDISALRATENFALYRVPSKQPSSGKGSLLAFQAERYVVHRPEWGRRRVLDPDSDEMVMPGFFYLFDPATCGEPGLVVIGRHDRVEQPTTLNEIVQVSGEVFAIAIYPVLPGDDEIYLLHIARLDTDEPSASKLIYTLLAYRPGGDGAITP